MELQSLQINCFNWLANSSISRTFLSIQRRLMQSRFTPTYYLLENSYRRIGTTTLPWRQRLGDSCTCIQRLRIITHYGNGTYDDLCLPLQAKDKPPHKRQIANRLDYTICGIKKLKVMSVFVTIFAQKFRTDRYRVHPLTTVQRRSFVILR